MKIVYYSNLSPKFALIVFENVIVRDNTFIAVFSWRERAGSEFCNLIGSGSRRSIITRAQKLFNATQPFKCQYDVLRTS